MWRTEERMFWTNRRVLVTGAGGYLGTALVGRLKAGGAHVVGIDVRPGTTDGYDEFITGDLCDPGGVDRALRHAAARTIFHLAGQSGVAASQRNPAAAFAANVQATWTLLDACRALDPVPDVVVASSNHVYGEQAARPTSEDAALNGLNAYATSKLCADVIGRCFGASYGLPLVVARITNSYGGVDPHHDHLIAGTILSVLRGEAPVIRGNGTAVKAYTYVEDSIDGLICLAENVSTAGLRGEAFNIVGSEYVSTLDTVKTILRLLSSRLEPRVLGTDPAQEEVEQLSGAEMVRRFGWRPRYSLVDGLRKAIEDYRPAAGRSTDAATRGH
jgi:CDP-glucose 4,6-dehydratase